MQVSNKVVLIGSGREGAGGTNRPAPSYSLLQGDVGHTVVNVSVPL